MTQTRIETPGRADQPRDKAPRPGAALVTPDQRALIDSVAGGSAFTGAHASLRTLGPEAALWLNRIVS
jgi:hypothetical protein